MFDSLISQLASLPQIEAIALGGSRAGDRFDAASDYDVYLYCTSPVPEDVRRELLSKFCSYMEIGNHFWELEDNCTLKNGVDMDILYRNLDDFVRDVASVAEDCYPRNGYTTCMWHNLKTCRILYDRDGRLSAAKQRFDIPYPARLKANIIEQNRKLLSGTLPAYSGQIKKAVERKDPVSVNHRTAAFLESYFDILFALNEQTHPGEKRLIPLCRERCPILPDRFEENLNTLFSHMFSAPELVSGDLTQIVACLEKIL